MTFSSTPSGIWPWPTTIRTSGSIERSCSRLGLDRLDPVVDVEDLAAAVELAQDRVPDEAGGGLRDPRLDGQPVLGRGLDDAEVADPGEGEVERAGDRGGREGEHVDRAPELLEALLGGNAEALLLVDDDETQVAEADVLREEPVGPDDEVDGPVGQAGDRPVLLGRRNEPGEETDRERERPEALAERRVVLGREHGRRHEHGHLLAVLDRLERAAQGDLGLAVANVANDEPVHRPAGFHVELHLGGGAQLVGRLLVREARLHLGLPGRVDREGVTARGCPGRVQGQQLLGKVGDRALDPLLRAQPLAAAEPARAGASPRRCSG